MRLRKRTHNTVTLSRNKCKSGKIFNFGVEEAATQSDTRSATKTYGAKLKDQLRHLKAEVKIYEYVISIGSAVKNSGAFKVMRE